MSMLNKILLVVIGVLVVALGYQMYRVQQEQDARDEAASELFLAEAEIDSLEFRVGEQVSSFEDLRISRDDTVGALNDAIARLEATGADGGTVIDIEGSAADTATTPAVVVRGVDSLAVVDSITSEYSDEVVELSVRCEVLSASCLWKYQVEISGELLHTDLPDGRKVVFAEPSSDKVTLRIPRVTFVPNEPPSEPWIKDPYNIGCIGAGVGLGALSYMNDSDVRKAVESAAMGCIIVQVARIF